MNINQEINTNTNGTRKCFFSKGMIPQQAALLCARSLLKAINGFVIPPPAEKLKSGDEKDNDDDEDKKFEFQVVRIVWNGLVQNNKKPSMYLGRTSLIHVFPLIKESCFQLNDTSTDDKGDHIHMFPNNVDLNEAQIFFDEFGELLTRAEKRKNTILSSKAGEKKVGQTVQGDTIVGDDDSCLLWDTDGGISELERRRKRRESKSAAMKQKEKQNEAVETNSNDGLTIEEIDE